MKKDGNKTLITILSIATLCVAMISTAFAYFSTISTTETQTITTSSSSINILSVKNEISNIKPTTFQFETVNTNSDVHTVTITITGETSEAGKYTMKMNQPNIVVGTEPNNGTASDIKYALYEGTTQKLAPTSFTGTGSGKVNLLSNVSYAAGNIAGEYKLYIWIENNQASQNNLQNIDFDLSFNIDTTSE